MEIIQRKKELFGQYYSQNFSLSQRIIPDLKFRHFRFQMFSNKTSFQRVHDIIYSPLQLKKKLVNYCPFSAFFTPVKWLNPIFVGHTKNELDVMLSSPLYFDIDMQDLTPPNLSEAVQDANLLIKTIEKTFSRLPDLIVFSGRQGFHIYYWHWDDEDLLKLDARKRIAEFTKRRSAILDFLDSKKIIVDKRITADPFRIMKIPNTLHGKTGLLAKPVTNLERFNPFDEAAVFDKREYIETFGLNIESYLIK
jgi:DNA primase catalytic subunit